MKKMLTNDNANAMEVLSFENVRTMLGERSRQANKGDNGKGLVIAGSLLLFFGFAAFAYIYALFFNRIFDRCMPQNTEHDTKDDIENFL